MEEVQIGDTVIGMTISDNMEIGVVLDYYGENGNIIFFNTKINGAICCLSIFYVKFIKHARTLLLEKDYLHRQIELEKEEELIELEREFRLDLEDAEEDAEDYDF